MIERNWAGNQQYLASHVHRPSTLEAAREIVATAPHVRVTGSRHSFTDLPDAPELIDLGAMPEIFAFDLFGAPAALVARHPVIDLPAESCTEQQGIPGRWSDRLPHFRHDFRPSAGDEIQSEFFVEIASAPAAIGALLASRAEFADMLLVGEIRTVAADRLWMSPQYGQNTVAFHFTWRRDQVEAERSAAAVADALGPFRPRPHWGKVFPPDMDAVVALERLPDFVALADRVDQRGAFHNDWFRRTVLRAAGSQP